MAVEVVNGLGRPLLERRDEGSGTGDVIEFGLGLDQGHDVSSCDMDARRRTAPSVERPGGSGAAAQM